MTSTLSSFELKLIDGWQRGFPLAPRPFQSIAQSLAATETNVIDTLSNLSASGVISRVGATIRPNAVGASMLAAMRVAPERLEAVAAIVNQEKGVNHNYERENEINLWFVITGPDNKYINDAVTRIESRTGIDVIRLPLERSYRIDLGFPINGSTSPQDKVPAKNWCPGAAWSIDNVDRRLLIGLEAGLKLEPEPYRDLADQTRTEETDVLDRLGKLIANGVISRFGLILRHRNLGYRANAMAVWDVPDEIVNEVGARFASVPFVTLCYRRPRRLPDWPYNLFCMVHGRERDKVVAQVRSLTQSAGLHDRGHTVLFSRRCFRQRGAVLRAA